MKNKVGCYDCGLEYGGDAWIEAVIPDKVWEVISPSHNQGGILCISCIARRLTEYGFKNIPIWLCGTEPLMTQTGGPDEKLEMLRNWFPDNWTEPKK